MRAINSIKVFTQKTCAPCNTVKQYLMNKGLPFEEIDTSQDPDQFNEVIKMTGAFTTPQVLVDYTNEGKQEQKVIVGLNLTKLSSI